MPPSTWRESCPPPSTRKGYPTGAPCRSRSRWRCCWRVTRRRAQRHRHATSCARESCTACGCGLRAQEWIRRNPEIPDERDRAPIVVVGMMRSGTTLLQRLLAADPRFHCAYGWEVVEAAPRLGPGSRRRGSADRDSEAREEKSRELRARSVRDPPDVRPRGRGGDRLPRRRVPVARPRGRRAHVPGTGRGSTVRTSRPRTRYLHRMLQLLQWQKRQRGETSRARWVLKSPAHLGYLDTLRAQFPDAAHRAHAPRSGDTIASGASLNTTLHGDARATTSTRTRSAPSGSQRMGWTNDRAMAARDAWTDEAQRVTDIAFADAVADPIGQVARVYDAIGLDSPPRPRRRWTAGSPRTARARRCRPALRARRLRAQRRADRRAVRRLQRPISRVRED